MITNSHNIVVQRLSGSADFLGVYTQQSNVQQKAFNAVQTIFKKRSYNNTSVCNEASTEESATAVT